MAPRDDPRTGGIALFAGFMAAALLAQWLPVPRQDPKELTRFLGIALGCAFLFVVGLIDDKIELKPALNTWPRPQLRSSPSSAWCSSSG